MTAHFLGSLEDMHGVAEAVTRIADREELAGRQTREQFEIPRSNN